MRLSFYGAAGEVTGSCYVVETARARVMVDFGMHQGEAVADEHNRRLKPIDFARLDTVLLTHAHLDHAGRLPMLAGAGYRGHDGAGRVWATPATIGLCDILLKDSAALMGLDVERAQRKGLRTHAAPLYGMDDVERLLPRLRPIRYDEPREVADGITVRYVDAGHILGAASIEMTVEEGGRKVVIAFSGDIGERGVPLLKDPVPIPRCDVMLLESTYGDRDHRSLPVTLDEFVAILTDCRGANGKVLIPAFAVGRTQQIVYHIGDLIRQGRLREQAVYVDSPMALAATDLYTSHKELWDDASWAMLNRGDLPLSFPGLHYTRTSQESMALNTLGTSAVIISASGMCTGGRILHHLKHHLGKAGTCVMFVGYQGAGTLGRRLVDGAKGVSIMGEPIEVRAAIHTLGGFSAHAGQTGLMEWALAAKGSRPRVFLTHGEDGPRGALRDRLGKELGMKAQMPVWGQSVEL